MKQTFKENYKVINEIVKRTSEKLSFAGKHVKNYLSIYFIVEEKVRLNFWRKLPRRRILEEKFGAKVNHDGTNIACYEEKTRWIVLIKEGEKLEIKEYG